MISLSRMEVNTLTRFSEIQGLPLYLHPFWNSTASAWSLSQRSALSSACKPHHQQYSRLHIDPSSPIPLPPTGLDPKVL